MPVPPDALDSLHERCLQGCVEAIQSLKLPNLAAVYAKTFPDELSMQYPCVLVTLGDQTRQDGTFETLAMDYGLIVAIYDAAPPNQETLRPRVLGWRQAMLDYFESQTTIPQVPESWNVLTEERATLDDKAPGFEKLLSAFTVKVSTEKLKNKAV